MASYTSGKTSIMSNKGYVEMKIKGDIGPRRVT